MKENNMNNEIWNNEITEYEEKEKNMSNNVKYGERRIYVMKIYK